MKIMHVLKHCGASNGHVHVAVDLACTQAQDGHEVIFASAGGTYEDLLRDNDVIVAPITQHGFAGISRAFQALLSEGRLRRPDVIHAHMMSSALLAFPVSKMVDAPLVTTVHNSFDRHSALMRLGQVIVAVSEADKALLLAQGFPAHRLVVVLNGATRSPRQAVRAAPMGSLRTPTIMTLSGLHERKDVATVIIAFEQLTRHFPEWHLTIVGEGPERLRLEQLINAKGLESCVHLLGSSLQPGPLLRQAAIFVTASRAEPFGLSVAEAREAGCAIVATNAGGIPEVLDNGRAGVLINPNDPNALAAALRRLMEDPTVLHAGRNSSRQGSERFSVQRMTSDYYDVYELARSDRRRQLPASSAPSQLG